MNAPADLTTADVLTRRVWASFFGPEAGPAYYEAGLTWEQAIAKQREHFVATFGEHNGNLFADMRIPTSSATFVHRVCSQAKQQIQAAESRAQRAEAALAERIDRDRRAADEFARRN